MKLEYKMKNKKNNVCPVCGTTYKLKNHLSINNGFFVKEILDYNNFNIPKNVQVILLKDKYCPGCLYTLTPNSIHERITVVLKKNITRKEILNYINMDYDDFKKKHNIKTVKLKKSEMS
jgi:uncharacterized protein (DUF2225 family)